MAATRTKAEQQVKSLLDIQEIRREKAIRAKASFAYFLKQAWHVIEPVKPFIEGIHTEACVVHLQALADGDIHRLVANLPPGFGKSTYFSVAYPAWIWTRNPHEKFLCASYAMDLSIRDRRNCRMLIESEWYQSLFGDVFQMATDQNVKSFYENDKRGFMQATATFASGTGKRADTSIIDDPNNAMAGKAEVVSTREWFGKTWIPRLNDRENGTMIIVGQRLDANDLTAHVLELGGWTHLCLPMEYEPARKCYTSIGWEDTRTQEGELLCSKLVDGKGVEELKHSQGSIDYAAQQQQAPVPAGGSKFKEKWFRYYAETEQAYILKRANETKSFLKTACWKFGTVDLAISKRTSADFTVMCVWAVTPEMDLLLLHVFRDRVSDAESLAQLQVLHGFYRPDFWKFEVSFQEAIFNQALRKGIPCRPFRPDGDKERRATPAAVWLENEKVFYLEHAAWLDDWKAELLMFPKGAHDDQVDNQSMAALEICDGGDIPFAATSLSAPESGILSSVYKPQEGEMSSTEEQDLQRRQEQVARFLQEIIGRQR